MALQIGHSDSQQLTASGQVPHTDVAHSCCGKHLTVLVGEGQAVDLVVVCCLDELV